jgi:hypothetical protein
MIASAVPTPNICMNRTDDVANAMKVTASSAAAVLTMRPTRARPAAHGHRPGGSAPHAPASGG